MLTDKSFFETSLRNHALVRARDRCREGWATLSEEELAGELYKFCMEINEHLVRINEHYANLILDQANRTLPALIIKTGGPHETTQEVARPQR